MEKHLKTSAAFSIIAAMRGLLLLPLLVTLAACPQQRPDPPKPVPSMLPPLRLTLPRTAGGKLSLEALRGHPIVITLFTTWCLRCQAEAPLFVRLHERLRGRGLRVVGIALDLQASLVRTYVEFVGFKFDVLLATPDDLELVGAVGATRQVPRTLLVDSEGRVVLDQSGFTDFATLEPRVEKLL
jgi:peroxiredoxin